MKGENCMKMCIEISGGMIQNIYAIGIGDEPVEIEIVDFDLDEDWEETDESCAERAKRLADFKSDPGCRRVW